MEIVHVVLAFVAILASMRMIRAVVEWSAMNYPMLGSNECNVDDVTVALVCDPDAILQRANLCMFGFVAL